MQKKFDLRSFLHLSKRLTDEEFFTWTNYLGFMLKPLEKMDLVAFLKLLIINDTGLNVYDCFQYGYEIPQIGKEFDLIRLGTNYHVNIEIKHSATKEKAELQLRKNFYYLNITETEVKCFSYIFDSNSLYVLSNNELVESSIDELHRSLSEQIVDQYISCEKLFIPENYLISPFNQTEQFLNNHYFLTSQQIEIENKIAEIVSNEVKQNCITVQGAAGTGKTLLIYDFAKRYMNQNKNVKIVHCGILNSGHETLKQKYNWDILSIKEISYKDQNFKNTDIVIVDESQRIYPVQYNSIIEEVKERGANLIFTIDPQQYLSRTEERFRNYEKIISESSGNIFELTGNIRSNREIFGFVNALFFNKARYSYKDWNFENVSLYYYSNINAVKELINNKVENGWTYITYTPSRYDRKSYDEFIDIRLPNAHKVIGQDFDNVIAVITREIYYEDGDLTSGSHYYQPDKMLYQIITRAKKRLCLVFYGNIEVFNRAVEIVKSIR